MKIKSIFLAVFCLLQITVFAQSEANNLFAQANELYKQKKYAAATKVYEDILKTEVQSVELHYNLANTYFKNEELGKAIVHYERALLIEPSNEDVVYNLSLAEANRVDEIENLPQFFLASWWQNMRQMASSTSWSIFGLLLLWASAAGFIIWLMGKSRKHKKLGFIGGLVTLLLSFLPFSLAYSRVQMEKNSGSAIILVEKINLKSGPDAASTTLNTLHEGTKVALTDAVGEWHQVRLPNGEIGWLEIKGIEQI
ncbi:MAG: tetratricopeptide (TPR) repeat protein [Paraglaciecola sp.]|jgi:tetratricopeptide (TPR) repeat protein